MKKNEKKQKKEKQPEVKIELPDLGLSEGQIDELKKKFENNLLVTLNEAVSIERYGPPKSRFPPRTIVQKSPHPRLTPIPRRKRPK